MTDGLTATPHPQPIDPADVRVGDRVRVVARIEATVSLIEGDGTIYAKCDDGGVIWAYGPGEHGFEIALYLLDRPDPDTALIEAMAERAARADDAFHDDASHDGEWPAVFPGADAYRAIARAALAALRETHTIEPRPTTGDLHA